jgi:hypothetical protein
MRGGGTSGEKGIRTPGTVSRTHAFQACTFNRSAISPEGVERANPTPSARLKGIVAFEKGEPVGRAPDTNPRESRRLVF